jgi:DNA-binding CsgD family transcriptional regulator
MMAQRLEEAAHAAEEALQFGREVRADNHMLMPRGVIAAVAALRGEEAKAHRTADEILAVTTARGLPVRAALAHYALGMLHIGRGRWAEALERFDTIAKVGTIHAMRVAADHVEAAVRVGRHGDAADVAAAFEAWSEQTGSPWGKARAASCRALLREGAEATACFDEAIRRIDDARPFDRARIHLLYGEHLRRIRRRADARAHLRTALEDFERFRAAPWVERAASELRATGETARKRDPSTFDQLTPQELHISRLVAQGMSNKEVAAQLFLSPRTIDYHLRNVFSKLGLTSRTQLVRMDFDGQEAPAASAVGAAG